MRRVLTAVLLVCCVLSGAVLGVPSGAPARSDDVAQNTNATGSLTIGPNALEDTSYQQLSLDGARTFQFRTRQTDGKYRQHVLDERFEKKSTSAKRKQVHRTASRIESKITQLKERQSTAVNSYDNGSASTTEFVARLTYISVASKRLSTAANRLSDRASPLAGVQIENQTPASWALDRQIALSTLQGPVRDRIARTIRGENTVRIEDVSRSGIEGAEDARQTRLDSLQVYVETSSTGVILATVEDGYYYREAYLPSVSTNASVANETMNTTEAFDRGKALYPWAWNHSSKQSSQQARQSGIFQLTLNHNHGRIVAYLNQDVGGAFAEQQRARLANLPTTATDRQTIGDFRLRVNRTHPTGPLEVSLSTRDGEPADAYITVNGHTVGATGSDGHIWTLTPRGNVTVAANASGETAQVTFSSS